MRDEQFIRGDIPMTKSEIRAIALSKLELRPDSIIYDIGAGTGSVSIEAALTAYHGRVYAIEKNPAALHLIRENAAKFNTGNITVIPGKAPHAFGGLEAPSHAFVGGTSGGLCNILDCLLDKRNEIRIVVTAITLETLSDLCSWIDRSRVDAEVVQVSVARSRIAGGYHMMMGQNPIYIAAFDGKRAADGGREDIDGGTKPSVSQVDACGS